MVVAAKGSAERIKWSKAISKAEKDFKEFHQSGDTVVKTYRIDDKSPTQKDKYNILYANTETIKPALYSQTPKVEVKQRQQDQNNPLARAASTLLESSLEYVLDEQTDAFDDVMGDIVQDMLLPGMGVAWVRYLPTFQPLFDENKQPVMEDDGKTQQEEVVYERVSYDYVYWKDFLCSKGRRWSEVWWVAKGVWMDKSEVVKRFGKNIASKMSFASESEAKGVEESLETGQARIWEIWDKRRKKTIWFSEGYGDDILDIKDDPLRLTNFFPCPRPIRAISTTNKFIPRPFYSEYQAQADELNDITGKIRRLVDALRVVGIYDASVDTLKNLLTGVGNKMVPVEGWATVQDKGGLKGVVDFLPITEIASVLMQLYDARDRVKNEIYEITGWSDIIRGVSKASETLGAQKLKSDWAGSRLKLMQREVQRFIRDLFRIGGEIIAEHYSEGTLALAAGLEFTPQNDELRQLFSKVTQLLKNDRQRCNAISIETDSTLMPDEANDKKERMEFLGAAGAFLQQAVPAAQTTPAMGPLLGQILMFAVRSFRSARPLEQEFERFVQVVGQQGLGQPPGQGGEKDGQAKVQAAMAAVQQKGAAEQQKTQLKGAELNQQAQQSAAELQVERDRENNRHTEAMAELGLREREVRVKEAELGLAEKELDLEGVSVGADIRLKEQEANKPDGA